MRFYTPLIGVVLMAVPLVTTSVALAQTAPVPNGASPAVASQTCPAGYVWEAAGYVGSGKWREGHCANGLGHE